MPLENADPVAVSAFKADKHRQAATIMAPAGAQIIQAGEQGTQFTMATEINGVHEGVIFGQWPHLVMKTGGSPRNPVRRPALDAEKPVERRSIDMTDDQIRGVLAAWAAGQSAIGLPGVVAVYRDGKLAT